MLLPKYSSPEIERRWTANLAQVGSLSNLLRREIEDKYITGTHIRLRKVSASTETGAVFKLGKKYGKGKGLSEQVVSIYLTEEEFYAMSALPGTLAKKSRYTIAGGALDVYQHPHAGLAVFEMEFLSESAAMDYTPPAFARQEITHDPSHSGFALSQVIVPYIRKAQLKDAQAVHTIRHHAIRAESKGFYPANVIDQWTAGDVASAGFGQAVAHSFYVAELQGLVVACGAIDIASGKLDAIFVDPAHMRKGLGRAMLQYLEQLAIAHKLEILHLEATLNAVNFYTRNGFVSMGNAKYESPRGFSMDCVVMQKQI